MKMLSRSTLALLCLAAATLPPAHALTPAAQVDTQGRVVRDANGARHNYGPGPAAPAASGAAHGKVVASAAFKPVIVASKAGTGVPRVNANAMAGPSYAENWRFNNWGWGIGQGGFWPVDIDANGDKEIVYGLGGGQWAIADYHAATRDYRVLYKSPVSTVTALRVVEVGNTKNVWVARGGDFIDVYDVITRAQLAHLPLPAGVSVFDFALADGNNDGSLDLVALANDRILFYDPVTFVPAAAVMIGGSSNRFAIGNVDADPAREIVVNDGRVLVVTGSTFTVQWQNPASFGWQVALADVDGDGKDELFASLGWGSVQAWDLDIPASKWQHTTSQDIAALRMFDVTGDGVPELIYGDGQWGSIHAIDANTNVELWTASNPEHGVTDVAVFDADGDGKLELLWGAGATSSGPDYLYVVDVATRTQEWQSFDIASYYPAVDVGDLDNDGRLELVAATTDSESGYGPGALLVFDAITHELEYRSTSDRFGNNPWWRVYALRVANVDADPQPEILIGTGDPYDGGLYVIDGITHQIEYQWRFEFGSPLAVLGIADVDGDGQNDVVAGNSSAHSGSTGQYYYVINPRTGAMTWKSQALGGYATNVQVADVGAPGLDLLATVSGVVWRVRWSDKQQVTSTGSNYYTSLLPMDVTGSAALELVAGRADGAIDILDGETLAVLATRAGACTNNPVGTTVAHGPHVVALVCGSAIEVYNLDTSQVVSSADTGLVWAGVNGSLVRFIAQGKSAFLIGGEWPAVFLDLSGNRVPTIPPRSVSLHWRDSADVTITGSDPDDDPMTYQIVGLPGLGTASWTNQAAGVLRYVAGGTAKGSDSVTLRAYDGFQFSDPQTLSVTLTNTPPVTTTSTLSFHWRGAQTASLLATDPHGDPLTIALGAAPVRGTLALTNANTGEVRYEPTGAFVGADTITYTASDGVDVSAAKLVQVSLTNNAPSAPAAAYAITIGNTVAARVAGADADADPLTYAIATAPSRGTLTIEAATGLFEYVPAAGTGNVTAAVVVRDGVGESAPVTLTFNYPAPPAPPAPAPKGGGGGSLDLLLLAMMAAGALRRLATRLN